MFTSLSFNILRNCKFIFNNASKQRIPNFCCVYSLKQTNYYCCGNTSKITAAVRENPVIMKLDTPNFHAMFTLELQVLFDLFTRYGYELRIAGGAVRDLLGGQQPKDLDLATTATPSQMKSMFETEKIRMLSTTGEKHGTITPRINDKQNFEITTLRVDVETDGRHAKVEYTTDWMLDANRRDLTINSMFLGQDGTVFDYFFGYEDLLNKRVVFVGDAESRIKEDYLRILRYFRFYGRISDKPDNHDSGVIEAIRRTASGLKIISGERIWSELSKILTGNYAVELVIKMLDIGIGPYIGFPSSPNIEEFQKVWDRSKYNNLKPITLISALLNSIKQVQDFHARVKLSSFDRDLALFIVPRKNFTLPSDNPLLFVQTLWVRNSRTNHIREYVIELLKYHNFIDVMKEFESCTEMPKCPVNGKVLLDLGVPHGKELGYAMDMLKEEWIRSGFIFTKEQLLDSLPAVLKLLNIQPSKKFKVDNK